MMTGAIGLPLQVQLQMLQQAAATQQQRSQQASSSGTGFWTGQGQQMVRPTLVDSPATLEEPEQPEPM